jgi:DNA-binding transcriptional MerR regulator
VDKAPEAFRTISEVAEELDVPQHVLRFWETRFREIKPLKRGGGRRYYRPDDVNLLRGIRHLLYGEGYTIRGVQRILREQGMSFVQEVWQPGAPRPPQEQAADRDDAALPAAAAIDDDETADAPMRPEPALATPAPRTLAPEHRQRLAEALRELAECRKLLDAALHEPR